MDFGIETVGVSFETGGGTGSDACGGGFDGPGVDSSGRLKDETGVVFGRLRTGTDLFRDDDEEGATIVGTLALSVEAPALVCFDRVVVTRTGVDFFLLTPD